MPAAQPGALTADAVGGAVYRAVRHCATHLRPDVLAAMQAAREDETQPRAQSVLDCLLDNARIGQEDGVPICQDTGTVLGALGGRRGPAHPRQHPLGRQ